MEKSENGLNNVGKSLLYGKEEANMNTDSLMGMKDAARCVGQTYMRLYMAVRFGDVPSRTIGGKKFIDQTDLETIKIFFKSKDRGK